MRVSAPEKFPTVADAAQEMEYERDIAEEEACVKHYREGRCCDFFGLLQMQHRVFHLFVQLLKDGVSVVFLVWNSVFGIWLFSTKMN